MGSRSGELGRGYKGGGRRVMVAIPFLWGAVVIAVIIVATVIIGTIEPFDGDSA